MESDFTLCIASVGVVAFQGLGNAWIKHVANLSLLKHSRITVSFVAPSLFLNTGGALGYLEVLWVDKCSSYRWNKKPSERCRA